QQGILGEGGRERGEPGIEDVARSPRRRGRQARYAARRDGGDRSLPRQAQRIIQVRRHLSLLRKRNAPGRPGAFLFCRRTRGRVGKAKRAHHAATASKWWARRKSAFAHPTVFFV